MGCDVHSGFDMAHYSLQVHRPCLQIIHFIIIAVLNKHAILIIITPPNKQQKTEITLTPIIVIINHSR